MCGFFPSGGIPTEEELANRGSRLVEGRFGPGFFVENQEKMV